MHSTFGPRARLALFVFAIALGSIAATTAAASSPTPLTVAYAGSMGAVMDQGLGPGFDKANDTRFQGIGQGAYGLARLLAAKQMRADVFVSITPGPVEVLQQAGLLAGVVPVASTQMVIAYSPRSRFAAKLKAAADGRQPWYQVLQAPGLRFGRTDPAVDPQGRNIVFCMLLAQRYYRQPGLADRILGKVRNPRQIFAEPSLLSRLESGQVDASSAYLSAAVSHRLPYILLPDEINLSNPAMAARWYSRAKFSIAQPDGSTDAFSVQPLVFYAGVLKNAAHPALARKFVQYLQSPAGQALLKRYGYGAPKGPPLEPAG